MTSALRDADNLVFVEDVQAVLVERGRLAKADGWAGNATRAALGLELGVNFARKVLPGPVGFRGDLARIHKWEAHKGYPYWPGGGSGVTLDPGFDLGFQNLSTLREHYGFLGGAALDVLAGVLGITGAPAKAAAARPEVRAVRISEAQALRVMPAVAARYWREIVERFPMLDREKTPAAVQTALLSLAYNRGSWNPALDVLAGPLARGDWKTVADTIAGMQQTHRLAGVRRRRREEAEVIRGGLEERVA